MLTREDPNRIGLPENIRDSVTKMVGESISKRPEELLVTFHLKQSRMHPQYLLPYRSNYICKRFLLDLTALELVTF